jgi:hypothetical protein
MRCRTARGRILQRRDAALAPSVERSLAAHRSTCGACDGFARDLEAAGRLLAELPLAAPSPSFDRRLKLRLARLERAPLPEWIEPPRRWRWAACLEFGVAAAVAASLVLFVGMRVAPRQQPGAPSRPALRWDAPGPLHPVGEVRPLSYPRPIGPQPAPPQALYFDQTDSSATAGNADSNLAPSR